MQRPFKFHEQKPRKSLLHKPMRQRCRNEMSRVLKKKPAIRIVHFEKMFKDRVLALSFATVEYRIVTCEFYPIKETLLSSCELFTFSVIVLCVRSGLIFSKGSGSHVHVCPRPLFEHLSADQAFHPSTCLTTAVVGALMPPLPECRRHVCHRQETGLSP